MMIDEYKDIFHEHYDVPKILEIKDNKDAID